MGKEVPFWQFRWLIYLAVIATVLLVMYTDIFRTARVGEIPQLVWLLAAAVGLIALITMLSKLFRILDALWDNSTKLEKIAEAMEKNSTILKQINQSAQLSETAKTIAFHDADQQTIREAVLDKLQQHDFETPYKMIDEIANRAGYKEFAQKLRAEANKYRDATDQERINQVISHIEKLFESYQWARASTLIERLIKDEPNSEKAKTMRQKLLDKKEERKKMLFNAWDDAVKRQATDRSLEILRELDMYLTPNEGLALQEAAKDVFRNKLHNLGVQFSLAVSGSQWDKALQTGRQITRDFPNSKMAEEIREKWDILKQKVAQQSG